MFRYRYAAANRVGMKIKLFLLIILYFSLDLAVCQDVIKEFKQFFYPNGALSSQGFFMDNVPHGTWKTYYPDSTLKSVGKRNRGLTDSLWFFFDELGDTIEKVYYCDGYKDGILSTYYFVPDDDNPIKSLTPYQQDKRQGIEINFETNGDTLSIIPFDHDFKHGIARNYQNGKLYLLSYYRHDTLLKSERVNQLNNAGEPHGNWVTFHENGILKKRQHYKNGLLHDEQETYNEQGELISKGIYDNGKFLPHSTSLFKLEVTLTKKYNADSILVFRGVYQDRKPVGMHRWYDSTGALNKVQLYSDTHNLIGEGMITPSGLRTGKWHLFYDNKQIKATGFYQNNRRNGQWRFYYPNGRVMQEGGYYQGQPEGQWNWYYPEGQLKCEENYMYGEHEGIYREYDSTGTLLVEGEYIQGKKEGQWKEIIGDLVKEGNYNFDEKTGTWRQYYKNGGLYFKGDYLNGNPDGKHQYFYANGKLKEIQYYKNGRKIKNWQRFTEDGHLLLILTFQNNRLVKINGKKTDIRFE